VNPYPTQVLSNIYRIDACAARSKGFEEVENMRFDLVTTSTRRVKSTLPGYRFMEANIGELVAGMRKLLHSWLILTEVELGGEDLTLLCCC